MIKRVSFPMAVFAALFAALGAQAQSAAPIGLWQGEASGDYILVQQDGSCSASGSVNIAGTCSWSATSTGGVLTMTYQWTAGPAHLAWSIRWLGQNVILVNNVERFVRRG